jgi:hypothetical protein|tara:strand:+ start:15787 stop:16101 length:315 start_codon:yes stop_codon:yes gene_type:complete
MTQRVTGQRFRQRKLSTKQNLPIVREHEVEQLADDDASRHIPKVETGVEKGEEIVSSRYTPLGFHSYRCQRCDDTTTSKAKMHVVAMRCIVLPLSHLLFKMLMI